MGQVVELVAEALGLIPGTMMVPGALSGMILEHRIRSQPGALPGPPLSLQGSRFFIGLQQRIVYAQKIVITQRYNGTQSNKKNSAKHLI